MVWPLYQWLFFFLQRPTHVLVTMGAVLTSALLRVMEHLAAPVPCTWCCCRTCCTVEVSNTVTALRCLFISGWRIQRSRHVRPAYLIEFQKYKDIQGFFFYNSNSRTLCVLVILLHNRLIQAAERKQCWL